MAKNDNEKITEESKSHSSVKREERRKEVAHARRTARINQIVGWVVIAALAALVVWGIVALVLFQMDKVSPNSNYSDGLAANGYINGVTASSKVDMPAYKGIEVPYSEIEFAEADIDAEIESLVAGYEEVSTDESLKIKDGDKVDIGYVGSMDGVEFEGGSSDSYALVIGSGSFIPGFEEQLIGHDNMTSFDINVTFPEEYQSADLAGKDAVFAITVNGIYVTPEFTDDFVAENLSDEASTVAEYRAAVKAKHEKENTTSWVRNYLIENTTVKSYPSKYLKTLRGIKMYDDEQSYEMMNQMYQQYYGSAGYSSFEEYIGMSEAEYTESLKETAKNNAKEAMIYQAIVELEGATTDAAYYKAYLESQGQDASAYDTQVATSGEAFVLQQAIAQKALEIATEAAVIK